MNGNDGQNHRPGTNGQRHDGHGRPGNPGGPGQHGRGPGRGPGDRGRGGPGGRERRGPGAERFSGKAAAEHAIVETLRELEKPLTSSDFEAQKVQLDKLLQKVKPLRLKSIDELDFDARTRLFTAMLRAGRQPEVQDAEKEAKRKAALGVLGELWLALGDERRAALLFAVSGKPEPAMKMLKQSGEWQEAAELSRRQGNPTEAARLYEQHKDFAAAAQAFKEANDLRGWLRTALLGGKPEEAREAARKLGAKAARELLLKHGGGDIYLDLLAGAGDFKEIGRLYERAEQWSDAALAFEKAKWLTRAAECYAKAGDPASAERCVSDEAQSRLSRGDAIGAGEVWRKHGMPERAVELIRDSHPELAFKWLQAAGLDAQALDFAKARARHHAQAGQQAEQASWIERTGDLPVAAELYLAGNRPADALRLYEQLGDWEKAGEAAAKASQAERAVEFLKRAGIAEPEARVQALLPKPPEPEVT